MLKKSYWFLVVVTLFHCSHETPVSVSQYDKYSFYIERVRKDIQTVRGLTFITPVKIGFTSRERYSKDVMIQNRYANELLRTYKQLCFIPDTFSNLQKYLTDYYTSFPVAYYSTGTDSITLVDADAYDYLDIMIYLSHEFTHALQDQHFGIGYNNSIPSSVTSNFNSDYYIAQRSVIEGDAVVAMYCFARFLNVFSLPITDFFADEVATYLDSLRSVPTPGYVSISSEFPYVFGPLTISKIKDTNDLQAVNQLFHKKSILSTAEFVSGVKFEPATFNVSSILKSWYDSSMSVQFVDDDNYGAVMLMALLNKYVDPAHCKNGFGWRGDRLIYMRSNNQSWGKLVWSLVFKEPADAIYIMNGFDKILQARKLDGLGSSRTVVSSDSLVTFTTGQVTTSLIRSGSNLFWIENVDNAQTVASNIINSTLSKSTVSDLKLEVSPEVIKIKKAVFDIKVFGK